MFCGNCGKELPDGAVFCPRCGAALEATHEVDTPATTPAQSATPQQVSAFTTPATPVTPSAPVLIAVPTPQKSNHGRNVAIVIAAAVLAVCIGGVLGYRGYSANHGMRAVCITVNAPGYSDDTSTPIPVQVVGTDVSGNSVDKIAYLDASGNGLEVAPGNYTVTVVASPLSDDGSFYTVPDTAVQVDVGTDTPANSTYQLPDDQTIVLTPEDPNDVTQEQIDAAKKYAGDSGESSNSVNDMVDKTQKTVTEAANSTALSNVQLYGGTLYVGCAYIGDNRQPMSIPGATTLFVPSDHFMFRSGYCYYVEQFYGNGAGTLELHRAKADGSEDIVLASDVMSSSTPYLCGDWIVYQSYDGESTMGVARVNIETGVEEALQMPGSVSIIGATADKLIYSTYVYGSGTDIYCCDLDGNNSTKVVTLSGNDTVVYDNGLIMAQPYNSTDFTLTAYDLSGSVQWKAALTGAASAWRGHGQNGVLYLAQDKASSLFVVDETDGSVQSRVMQANGYLGQVLWVDGDTVYLTASDASTGTTIADWTVSLYKGSLSSGSMTKLQ